MTTSPPQWREALDGANEIRCQMAAVRRTLGNGGGSKLAAEYLDHPDAVVSRMRLGKFLTGLHRVGFARATKITRRAGLSASAMDRRIGPLPPEQAHHLPLTERQRHMVAQVLRKTTTR